MAITRDLWIVLRARDEASRIVRSFGTNVGGAALRASKDMSEFDRTMMNVANRLDQFARTSMLVGTVMAGLGAAGIAFIHSATKVAAEYDRQVRHTLTQVDDMAVSLEQLAQVGREVAREVGSPFEKMQETLFFIFSSIDVNVEQSQKLLKGFAKEAVAGQSTIEAAARSTISIMNSLGLTVNDLTRIQDIQFQVVRKGIITYEELSSVVGRALPATARAGQSFETLGAMIAFMTRNGLSAAMAATSAARALESFAHPKVVDRLAQIGINVRNAKGEFLPLIDVMEKMNQKIKTMAAPERAKFLQELFTGAGGTIQARRFWDTAFKNFDHFGEMMGHMKNSAGVFENAYEIMSESVAVKSELIRNKWMLIKEALGRAILPEFLKLMSVLERVLKWFDQLPEGTKTIVAQFILWGSVISVVVGLLIVLVGGLAFFVAGIMSAGTALLVVLAAIAAVALEMIALGAAITIAWQKSEGFRNNIKLLGEIFSDVWNVISQVASNIKNSFDRELAPSLERLADVLENKVVPVVHDMIKIFREEMVPRIEEAGRIISDIADKSFKYIADIIDIHVIPAIENVTKWWKENESTLRPLIDTLAQVVKWMLIIAVAIAAIGLIGFISTIATVIVQVAILIVVLKAVWSWIDKTANAFGNFTEDIRKSLVELGKQILGFFVDLINMQTTFIKVIADFFKGAGPQITNIWDNNLRGLWDKFFAWWKKIIDTVKEKVDGIKAFFSDAGHWLLDAGKDIVVGLINGITEKIKDLRKVLKNITDEIPKLKGPMSVDIKLLEPSGKAIMKSLMNGIADQMPMLERQLQDITTKISNMPSPTINLPAGTQGFATIPQQRNVTQSITIHTQEINPRIHATEIGWELSNRL